MYNMEHARAHGHVMNCMRIMPVSGMPAIIAHAGNAWFARHDMKVDIATERNLHKSRHRGTDYQSSTCAGHGGLAAILSFKLW
jgi:hypothetical protein